MYSIDPNGGTGSQVTSVCQPSPAVYAEFAVVFTDSNAATAARVMDEIRVGFAQIRHYFEGREYNVTFSCGIAALEGAADPAALYKAADQALYQAKHEGRNRVVLARVRN